METWLMIPVVVFLVVAIITLIFREKHKFVEFTVFSNFCKQILPWFFDVTFMVFFIGDQLTSISPLLVDLILIAKAALDI